MINFLEERYQVNKIEISSNFITNREKYDSSALQYFKEIPSNFISLQYARNKKELIKNHLEIIHDDISDEKIEIVLNRVLNLIRYVTSNDRSEYENFTQQHNFKEKNWKKIERCQLCGSKFQRLSDVSLEHVLPISLGGNDNDSNWQLLCKLCNNQKSNYWGLSDIKLVDSFISKNILKSESIKDIKDHLPKNTKYFILEKDKRKCTLCAHNATDTKLEVRINFTTVITIDSFHTVCEHCVKKEKIKKEELL